MTTEEATKAIAEFQKANAADIAMVQKRLDNSIDCISQTQFGEVRVSVTKRGAYHVRLIEKGTPFLEAYGRTLAIALWMLGRECRFAEVPEMDWMDIWRRRWLERVSIQDAAVELAAARN